MPANESRPRRTRHCFGEHKLDPALDDIIAPGAKLEVLGEHFGLTEGPVWVRDGDKSAQAEGSVVRNGKNMAIFSSATVPQTPSTNSSGNPLSVFLEKSGYTGKDIRNVGDQTISGRLAILLIGSNGLTLDAHGRLIITAITDRTVARLEKDGTLHGSRQV